MIVVEFLIKTSARQKRSNDNDSNLNKLDKR